MQDFQYEGKSYDDLYRDLARIRHEAPIFHWEEQNCWVLSRHADIQKLLTDSRLTVEGQTSSLNGSFCQEARTILDQGVDWQTVAQINNVDGPIHTRLRAVLQKMLTPKRLNALRPRIETIVNSLIDQMSTSTTAELIAEFCAPFTFGVLLDLVGVEASEKERQRLLICSDSLLRMFTAILTPAEQVIAATESVELQAFVRSAFDMRRHDPRDDILTELVRNCDDGSLQINEDELTMLFAFSLFVAGHETTKSMIANCVYQLLIDRQRWESLLYNEIDVADTIEELLRLDGVVSTLTRYLREPMEIAGISLPAGTRLVMLLPSANHDNDKYSDPESFCPARGARNGQLTFGAGAHFCVGASLARIEIEVALLALSSRLKGMQLQPGQQLQYETSFILRGLKTLRVGWDAVLPIPMQSREIPA